ncbi:MAG: sigma-70 family RNA polymerase sigma factor [Phycisphaeraceae bacterium]|nr:sigma-70 family RNA polymerase sigma factor [Phycisphaeraceae bacterium]
MSDPKDADRRELPDEQLLKRCRLGDDKALEMLIRRYRQELLNFLTRFCRDRATGEDIFQETFLQVYQSAESFDTSRRFKPWLFTIAANKARDYLRRRARRPSVPLDAQVGGTDGPLSFVDLMADDLPGPEQNIQNQERSRRIRQTVDRMPDHLSEILLLAYFQKMSYGQIAEILQIPLGTVKSRLHTAVGTFAKMWKSANRSEEPT